MTRPRTDHPRATLPILLIIAASATACGGSTAGERPAAGPPAPAVEVVQARQGSLPLVERLTGTARASGEVALYPETAGPVIEVLAQNGDRVRKGQPLVRIQTAVPRSQRQQAQSDLAAAEAQVREIEASLADLRAQLARTQSLAEDGLVSRQDVDTGRAQVEGATASLARARAEAAAARARISERSFLERQTVVRAPIDGRIGRRNVEVGMRVDPQTELFVIGQLDRMRVEVPVSQDVLAEIRRGQRVELSVGTGAPPIVAQVSRISPFLSPGSFSAEIEIDVPNDGSLVPGMFVTVDVFYGESEVATLVPTSAVYENPSTGEEGVFVVAASPGVVLTAGGDLSRDPMEVAFRPVDVLARGRHTVGLAGLLPDEWVVVVGQHLLAVAGGAGAQARVRAVPWDVVIGLQGLQREDLLRQFMDKQRRSAGGTALAPATAPRGASD